MPSNRHAERVKPAATKTQGRVRAVLRPHCATIATVMAATLLVSACTGRVNIRGNKPDPDVLTEIVEQKYSRAEVEQLIGTPSTVAVFSGEAWLYISKTTEAWAFLDPEIVEQTIVVVRFDDNDQVAHVDTLDVEDGRIVALNENTTPTLGNDFSAIEQLLNNVGRFNKE